MTDAEGADRAAHDAYTERLAIAGAAATRLREAAYRGDADAARAATTDDGWGEGRDSVSGLVRQVARKGLSLDPIGETPSLFGRRGATWVAISHPSEPKPLGDLFLLLEENDDGWKVAGATPLRAHVGLFLRGALPGFVPVSSLPPSERADDWAAPALAILRGESERPLPQNWVVETPPPDAEVEPVAGVGLPQVNRAAAGFRFKDEARPWGWSSYTILDTSTVPSTVVAARSGLSLDSLLTGLTVPWPKEDPAALGVELTEAERPTDDRGAAAIMSAMVRKNLDSDGIALDGGTLRAARARALLHYAALLGVGAPAASGDAAAAPPTVPPELRDALTRTLQGLIETGVDAPGGLHVDRAALEERGPALLGKLFSDLAAEALPEQLTVTVPVQDPEPGGPAAVTLRAEPHQILRGLMAGEE